MSDKGRELVEEALFLLQNGECAPGGTETWSGWARKAETWLRDSKIESMKRKGGGSIFCTKHGRIVTVSLDPELVSAGKQVKHYYGDEDCDSEYLTVLDEEGEPHFAGPWDQITDRNLGWPESISSSMRRQPEK